MVRKFLFRKELFLIIFIVISLIFVFASTPVWQGSDVNYSVYENIDYFHNLTLNISGYNNDITFEVNPSNEQKLKWTNNSGTFEYSNSDIVSDWIKILNSLEGILKINATLDNQTGFFEIPIKATNGSEAAVTTFEFIVYAINDPPIFLDLKNSSETYDIFALSENKDFFNITFSAFDEEEHYPLSFENLSVLSCEKAPWTNTSDCSLNYSFSVVNNTSMIISFTNISRENVGSYNLSVCIKDNINSTTEYPLYRVENYNENKTSCQDFSLTIYNKLEIDASNCSSNYLEGEELVCYINIFTKEYSENFSLWSVAYLNFSNSGNYISQLSSFDWFYSNKTNTSSNYFLQIPINVSLTKRNVGNWTINLVASSESGASYSKNFSVFVNKTNSVPNFSFKFSNPNNVTSVGAFSYFNFSVKDEDFLIPDKKFYNESVNLTIRIFNRSNNEEVFWQKFSNRTFSYVFGTNSSFSNQSLTFTPNQSQAGDWLLNFSYIDKEGNFGYETFNFSIQQNNPPYWSNTTFYINCVVNSTYETTSYCIQGLDLKNTSNSLGLYAVDPDGDSLSFYVVGSSGIDFPPNFSLTSNGIVNFRPWKQDVSIYRGGNWEFNLGVIDNRSLSNSSLKLIINVTNINSPPKIMNITLNGKNISSFNFVQEKDLVNISFYVYDDDLLIPEGYSTNKEGNFSITKMVNNLSGIALEISDFNDWASFLNSGGLLLGENSFLVYFNFTPSKQNAGIHQFNLSVRDKEDEMNWTIFNVTVQAINNAPYFVGNISNYSSAVGRNFYLKINASDEEDGDDSNGNLTFSYSLLNRNYFGRATKTNFYCESCFNSTRGIFNISFNESHAGVYVFNLSVRDKGLSGNESLNKTSSITFWLFVYDFPNITYPTNESVFVFSENSTKIFNFSVNHTVGNHLTYEFWYDKISCSFMNNSDCFYSEASLLEKRNLTANGTNISYSRYFGFDEESYGNLRNFTLVVYPNDTKLENRELVNSSITFKLNVTHVNFPPNASYIETKSGSYGSNSPIIMNLSNYFYDVDSYDSYYLENLTFFVNSNSSRSEIYVQSVESGDYLLPQTITTPILKLYALKKLEEYVYIVANDSSNGSVVSNNFLVIFVEPQTQEVHLPTSGGGGSSTEVKHASLFIEVPSLIRAKYVDEINFPVVIKNNGEVGLSSINLEIFFKNLSVEDKINASLSQNLISSLSVGESKNLSGRLNVDLKKAGSYLGVIRANVSSPRISQEANFYIVIEVVPSEKVEEVLVFTEKLLVDNPECAELRERLLEVKNLKEAGNFEEAYKLSNDLIDACKKSISQKRNFILFQQEIPKIAVYFIASFFSVIFLIVAFVIYKRVKFNKYKEEEI